MLEHKIKLQISEVKDFVARASACDFDIDVSYNHLRYGPASDPDGKLQWLQR